jgi:hypothetical protein
MDREIILTIAVAVCLTAISFVALAVIMRIKRWRKRRMIERGITDLNFRLRGGKT